MAQKPSYDHESVYQKIAAEGGRGWDDNTIPGNDSQGSYTAVEAFLASSWAPPPGARALDVGCGGGQVALKLVQRGYLTRGIDFSETAIGLARQNARETGVEVHFSVGDALALADFADGSADLIVDNHVLHCLVAAEDRKAFWSAALRVLAPGGRLFSETMTCEGDFDPVRLNVNSATRISRGGRRIWVKEAELQAELSLAGLTVLHRERRPAGPGLGDNLVVYAEKKTAGQ